VRWKVYVPVGTAAVVLRLNADVTLPLPPVHVNGLFPNEFVNEAVTPAGSPVSGAVEAVASVIWQGLPLPLKLTVTLP
jgi:hypothetical protein